MIAVLFVLPVLVAAFAVVTLAGAVLLVIKFGHPDDRSTALWPKAVVILGLFLAATAVFMFPLDAAVTGADPRLNPIVTAIWYAVLAGVGLLLVLVVPVSISVYEDADGHASRSKSLSVLYGLFPLILIGILAGTLYPFFGSYTLTPADAEKLTGSFDTATASAAARHTADFLLFTLAVLAMLGWTAFVLFVPIGLVVLPMDLINAFSTRPQPMSVADYSREKLQIGRKASHLLSLAKDEQQARERSAFRKSKLSRSERRAQIALEIETYELKKRQAFLEEAYALRGGNPLWYLLQLVLGIVFLLATASWIIHTVVFVVFGEGGALNNVLTDLQTFPAAGVVYFAVQALYLLAAGVKGAFRFSLGSRSLSIYPMEVGNTLMNAFLVNAWLVLALVLPLLQFCAVAFSDFAQGAVIAAILRPIGQLPLFAGFVFYGNVYIYVMGAIMFVTLLVTLVCPRNATRRIRARLQAIELR